MLTYPQIDPVAIALGPVKVHWYGLAYLTGLAFAWWFAVRRTRMPWSPVRREQVDDLIFYAALGVVLGGRFGRGETSRSRAASVEPGQRNEL